MESVKRFPSLFREVVTGSKILCCKAERRCLSIIEKKVLKLALFINIFDPFLRELFIANISKRSFCKNKISSLENPSVAKIHLWSLKQPSSMYHIAKAN